MNCENKNAQEFQCVICNKKTDDFNKMVSFDEIIKALRLIQKRTLPGICKDCNK